MLTGLALLALLCTLGVERFRVERKARYYSDKVSASELTRRAQEVVKEGRLERGLPIDPVNDPNNTGLIGSQYTLITTDRAALRMKLTSTNPNLAAVVVHLVKSARARKGDVVGVAFTGASPGTNIAVLAAIETLDLRPIIITSVGASSWGATDPAYTWLDMETELHRKRIFEHTSVAASLGGGADLGNGLSPRGRRLIREAVARNGQRLIEGSSLEDNIVQRMAIYDSLRADRRMIVFINVGGGLASLGSSQNARLIPPGLTKRLGMRSFPQKGVTILMAERGVPIIHLLEIDRLADRFDLPVEPIPLPEIGEGKIFSESVYSIPLAISFFILYSIIMFCSIRFDMKHYLLRPKSKEIS